jgi:hypothetical protein
VECNIISVLFLWFFPRHAEKVLTRAEIFRILPIDIKKSQADETRPARSPKEDESPVSNTKIVAGERTRGEGKDTRELRGIRLYMDQPDEIVRYIDGTLGVPSRTIPGLIYHVNLEEASCECPDYTYRHSTCVHMIAAELKRIKALPRPDETKRQAQIGRRCDCRISVELARVAASRVAA